LVVDVNSLPSEKEINLEYFIEKLELASMNADMEAHIHQVFIMLDKNKRGYLTPEDLAGYLNETAESSVPGESVGDL